MYIRDLKFSAGGGSVCDGGVKQGETGRGRATYSGADRSREKQSKPGEAKRSRASMKQGGAGVSRVKPGGAGQCSARWIEIA